MLNKIDERFKNSLSELDTIPSDIEFDKERIWEAIDAKLDRNEGGGSGFNYKWFFLPGVLVIAFLLWYVLYRTQEEITSENGITVVSKAREKKEVTVQDSILSKIDAAEIDDEEITFVKRKQQKLMLRMDSVSELESKALVQEEITGLEEAVHIADVHYEEAPKEHVTIAPKKVASRSKRYYYKQYLNIESFNQYLDRERNYMSIVPEDSGDFFTTVNTDTVRSGKVIYYYNTGEIYEVGVYENYTLVSRKRYFRNGEKMLTEKSFSQQSQDIDAGNLLRGTSSVAANTIYKKNTFGDQTFSFGSDSFSEVISVRDSNGTKLVKGGVGQYVEHYPNGKLMLTGQYREGVPEGEWTGYYENGNVMYTAYYNPAHVWLIETIYDPKGNILVQKGKGKCVLYYPDGQIQFSGVFNAGRLNGEVESYYSNGQLKSKSYYEGGRLHGLYESYYLSGKLFSKGNCRIHHKTGEWKWYDQDGKVIRTVVYKK